MANEENSITVKDFELICRVCLKFSDNLVLISEFKIISMMSACTSVQIWLNDDLPNHICNTCFIDLKNSFNFKQLSENSDSILRNIVHKHNLGNKLVDKTDTRDEKDFDDNFIDSVKYEFESDCETKIKDEYEETKILITDDTKNICEKQYKCEQCHLKFSHLRHLGLHMKRQHKLKKCNICHKTFKTPSKLMRHSVIHGHERPYQCPQCGKTFKLDAALRVHRNLAHSTKDDRVPCDVCGKHVLKRHIQRHLTIHKNDRDPIQCDKCEKKFLHASSLKLHIKRDHEKIARELNHLCNTCGKKYASRISLERHSVVHKPDRPYQCTQCDKSFKLDFILTKHVRTMHASTANTHIRAPCNVCGKLISKTNMQTHLKIHRDDRALIKCDKCSKQFLHQLSLKQHIRREHENVARDLKHLCSVCGKGAGCRAELQEHMHSHSDEKNFKCDKCGMKYKSRAGLTHHIKTAHLNIKPHACTMCAQRFALKSTLASHMRTHTGERPFQCIVCEKSFSQKSSLRTHIKLVHSD